MCEGRTFCRRTDCHLGAGDKKISKFFFLSLSLSHPLFLFFSSLIPHSPSPGKKKFI